MGAVNIVMELFHCTGNKKVFITVYLPQQERLCLQYRITIITNTTNSTTPSTIRQICQISKVVFSVVSDSVCMFLSVKLAASETHVCMNAMDL